MAVYVVVGFAVLFQKRREPTYFLYMFVRLICFVQKKRENSGEQR